MAQRDNVFTKALNSAREALFPSPASYGWSTILTPGTNFDYQTEVGNGTGSSTIMAPLEWITRTFPEAPLSISKFLKDGQEEVEPGHDLIRLLHRPNPFFTGSLLWQATILDYYLDGNAYWWKIRDRGGKVAQLWWIPSCFVEPEVNNQTDQTSFIDYYKYNPNGSEVRIDPEDLVHFRYGVDPEDMRRGRSPLKSVLREVFTDDQGANYTAAILKNMGIPGLIITPTTDAEIGAVSDPKVLKERLTQQFNGDDKGAPLVSEAPIKVEQFSWNPEQLNLRELRKIPEERVSAVLGVPAIVAGLGAGLDRSTFANMSEAREMAYESNIIPAQRTLAEDIRFQLLSEFEKDPFAWKVFFDLSEVRVLQEDENKKAERLNTGVQGGWIKRSEARRELGLDAEDYDEVYLLSASMEEIVPGEEKEEPEPQLVPVPVPPAPSSEDEGEESEEAEGADSPEQVEEKPQDESV